MKKYLSLVKLLFIQQYRVKPQQGKRKKGGTIAAYIVLAVCFLPVLLGLALSMYGLGQASQGITNLSGITATIVFLCQGVVLMFGIPSLITGVFSPKDADKLLFLPVRSGTIFAAKLTVVYLNEVITTAVMIAFTLLPFGIGMSAGFGYYLMFVFALILIPLLPMLVGSVIAIPLSALIAKVGKNGALKTVLQILLFVIIMAVYLVTMYELGFVGGAGDVEGGTDVALVLLTKLQNIGDAMRYVHSDYTLASALISASFGTAVLNLIISVAENALLVGLVLLMAIPFYRWMLSTSVEGGGGRRKKSAKSGELQVKNKGVLKELIITDVKRVARDSQMGFQCIMSLVILPIMVVLFYVMFALQTGDDEADLLHGLMSQQLYQVIAPIAFLAYMSLLGMTSNVLGIYPISRENKAIYIIKSLPLSFNKYLLAKVILATGAMLISDTVMCILMVALFGIYWYYGILMLVTMALLGFGAMCITTLIDLKSPKLGWTNFNQSLKNAKNSWLAMLVGVICMIALALIAVGCIVGYAATDGGWYMIMIMWLLLIGFAFAFAAVSYKVMSNKAKKYFESIEP